MAQRFQASEKPLSAQLQSLDPASPRHGLLTAARDFKASWVQLAERLTQARERQTYAEWGYPSFEAYCRRELQIKQDTAHKLTRSFSYLRDHEPHVLGGQKPTQPPALDVVDLLSQAKARTQLSADAFETIREEAMAPEGGVSRAYVLKKLREADPEGFASPAKGKPTVSPGPPGPNDMRKALLLAERLHSVLSAQPADALPGALAHAAAVVAALQASLAAGEPVGANTDVDNDGTGASRRSDAFRHVPIGPVATGMDHAAGCAATLSLAPNML